MAGCVAVPCPDSPCKCEGPLLELPEVTHSEYRGTVLLRREEGQAKGIVGVSPVRINKYKEVPVLRKRPGIGIAFPILVVHILEIAHPIVYGIFKAFGGHYVCLDHEVLFKAYDCLCRVKLSEARVIDSFAENGRILRDRYVGVTDDPSGCGTSAVNGAVVEEQDVGILREAQFRRTVYGHPGKLYCSRTALRKFIGMAQILYPDHVVPVKSCFDRCPYRNGIQFFEAFKIHEVSLCRHWKFPPREMMIFLHKKQLLRFSRSAYSLQQLLKLARVDVQIIQFT